MSWMMAKWIALACVLLMAGCGDDDGAPSKPDELLVPPCDGGLCIDAEGDVEGDIEDEPDASEPQCPGSFWEPGTPSFREATAEWGLDDPSIDGIRISAADFDGDGWVDLSVRRAGVRSDDFASEGVRANWLFRNTGSSFEDVTESSGIRVPRVVSDPPLGRPGDIVVFGDIDNDGDLDAYVGVNSSVEAARGETSEIMINNGDGSFALGPEDNPIRRAGLPAVVASATFVDYDRDGLLDLWTTHNAHEDDGPLQDRLYRGQGDGHFVDVTVDAGLRTQSWTLSNLNAARAHSNAWSGAACDLNGDGVPELLSASYGRVPNHLWLGADNDGTVTFTNESIASGYAFDDRQDWSDNTSAQCFCKNNPDAPDCEGVPDPTSLFCSELRWSHDTDREVFRLGGVSGTTVCADINNDGWIDLLTNEIVHWDVGSSTDPSEILFNMGEAAVRFERPGNEVTGLVREHEVSGWNDGDMTSAVFDFDNDGWQDVYIGASDYPGTRGYLFHQMQPELFETVSLEDGIDHQSSNGIAVADFDNDGDLDLVVGHSRARCSEPSVCYESANVRFFENIIGEQGGRLELELEGAGGSNRAAIGARVEVVSQGNTQVREVGGGHGHFGLQNSLRVTFGLGTACSAEVSIRWPDRALTTETFTLGPGRYKIVQGGEPYEL